MPKLVSLYIHSIAVGFLVALVFTLGLIWWDVAGLGHLILGSDIGLVAVAMLVVFNGIVFSGVQFGFRVMGMAEDDVGPQGGHRQRIAIPVRVEARPVRRMQHRR